MTWRTLSEAAAAVAATGLVVGSVALAGGQQLTRNALQDYEERFLTIARDVGRVLEMGDANTHGMKRAIGAIEQGELGGAELQAEARAWKHSIRRSIEAIVAVPVPPGLGPATTLVVRSYETYVDLAGTLAQAADAPMATHDAILDAAVALGSQGDDAFDAAAAVIQRARRGLGLPPQASLPDPDRGLPEGVKIYDPDELYPEDAR